MYFTFDYSTYVLIVVVICQECLEICSQFVQTCVMTGEMIK